MNMVQPPLLPLRPFQKNDSEICANIELRSAHILTLPQTRTAENTQNDNSNPSTVSPAIPDHGACNTLGLLQNLWRRVKRSEESESVFVMVKSNYKIQANIGFSGHSTRRFTAVLETSANPSFIHKDVLLEPTWNRIQTGASGNVIRDANNRLVNVSVFVNLFVDIVGRSKLVQLNVIERLAAFVIIGCD